MEIQKTSQSIIGILGRWFTQMGLFCTLIAANETAVGLFSKYSMRSVLFLSTTKNYFLET